MISPSDDDAFSRDWDPPIPGVPSRTDLSGRDSRRGRGGDSTRRSPNDRRVESTARPVRQSQPEPRDAQSRWQRSAERHGFHWCRHIRPRAQPTSIDGRDVREAPEGPLHGRHPIPPDAQRSRWTACSHRGRHGAVLDCHVVAAPDSPSAGRRFTWRVRRPNRRRRDRGASWVRVGLTAQRPGSIRVALFSHHLSRAAWLPLFSRTVNITFVAGSACSIQA